MLVRHIRHYLLCITAIAVVSASLFATTACSDENKEMLPGEVRLKENTYHNDKHIDGITVATDGGNSVYVSALEIRTLWHSIIIHAEEHFEYSDDGLKNIYESPAEAEQQFTQRFQESMALFSEKYPATQQHVIEELVRADVYVNIRYVWCEQTDEYVTLKFEASPQKASFSPQEEENN